MKVVRLVTLALLGAIACGKKADSAAPAPSASVAATGFRGGAPCQGSTMECGQFETPEAAFRAVLEDRPLVLSIGEAHAQKGATVPSSAKRTTEILLPELKGKAGDLLVELMNPPQGCNKATAEVKEKQKVVTQKQAETDQNEYVQMGDAARKLGIVPDLLRPTCDDLFAINDAGADAIDLSLRTIERLTLTKVEQLRDRDKQSPTDAEKMVVTYGGAIHNDLAPPPERAAWSFGPALSGYVQGRYVALDVYVPEFIEDTDAWKKLEWYGQYDKARLGGKVTLFHPGPQSFVMIFALTR